METVTFPKLYKRPSTGATQEWEIKVEPMFDFDGQIMGRTPTAGKIITVYGLQGGQKQTAVDIVTEGKNVGKKNETTPFEQAVAEARSDWEKKQKRNYHQDLAAAESGHVDTNFVTGGVDPMLAQSYDKHASKISFPAYMQPKLDGHRCIAILQDGKCTLWSRTRKPITGVPHIARAIEQQFADYDGPTLVLDGELYNHAYRNNFEDLSSYIRSGTPKPGHEVVQYWVYDVVVEGATFAQRLHLMKQVSRRLNKHPKVTVVWTDEVEDADEAIRVFGVYLDKGFEGGMLRNAKGLYKGKRSYDLQKVKIMADAEYRVIDIVSGRGKMENAAIFVCETEEGKTFQCVMATSHDERERMLRDKDSLIGKMLTVKYQNLSNDGIPRFPVALRFAEPL